MPAIARGGIEVVELDSTLEDRYARFIVEDPAAMIYGTLEFRAFLTRVVAGTPRYFVALSDGRIVGALPAFVASNAEWGAVVNSLPWWGSHGGCLMRTDDEPVRVKLLDRWSRLLAAERPLFTTMILTPRENAHRDAYAAAVPPAATDQRIGQVTELPDGDADVEASLGRLCLHKTRNVVRKALKQGFVLADGDNDAGWRFLHETHRENLSAIGGTAKPASHFIALRETIPQAWRQLLVATLDGRPVAAVLLLRFNRTVEYITPVIQHAYRSAQPLSFLIWHAMLNAVADGYRWWNWGGTWVSQASLHHFKEGWGAAERPYTYLITASSEGAAALRANRQAIVDAFPYYFIYPFSALAGR